MVDDAAPTLPPPSANGAASKQSPRRQHAPWEFLVLVLFVALVAIGIIVGWTLVGSHSPERLDRATAADVAAACNTAQTRLKALPNAYPKTGSDRVARIRAENRILRLMVSEFDEVRAPAKTPDAALHAWSADWARVITARDEYASGLEASKETGKKVQFVLPAGSGIEPISAKMDDYVRESHPYLNACFTEALQLEDVEGPRVYKQVTS